MLKECFWIKSPSLGTAEVFMHILLNIEQHSPTLHVLATWTVAKKLSSMAKYRNSNPNIDAWQYLNASKKFNKHRTWIHVS
eukprot:3847644-Ditylum_brightwellii.AAC.1